MEWMRLSTDKKHVVDFHRQHVFLFHAKKLFLRWGIFIGAITGITTQRISGIGVDTINRTPHWALCVLFLGNIGTNFWGWVPMSKTINLSLNVSYGRI